MAIGPALREARLRKQLTTSQVAEITRMKVQIVDDLEKDDFHRIAATIYGKGFIKLFAECVEINPDPLIEDYLRQASGQPPLILPAKPAELPPVPVPVPVPAAPEPPQAADDSEADNTPAEDLFAYAKQTHKPKRRTVAATPPPPAVAPATQPKRDIQAVRQTLQARLAKGQNSCRATYQAFRTRTSRIIDSVLTRIAEAGSHDKWIQRILVFTAVLVLLLILVQIIRFLVSREPPALPDNELILLVPPPEPYL
jgi:hypothetical protein